MTCMRASLAGSMERSRGTRVGFEAIGSLLKREKERGRRGGRGEEERGLERGWRGEENRGRGRRAASLHSLHSRLLALYYFCLGRGEGREGGERRHTRPCWWLKRG